MTAAAKPQLTSPEPNIGAVQPRQPLVDRVELGRPMVLSGARHDGWDDRQLTPACTRCVGVSHSASDVQGQALAPGLILDRRGW
jgi:hypothetical protein